MKGQHVCWAAPSPYPEELWLLPPAERGAAKNALRMRPASQRPAAAPWGALGEGPAHYAGSHSAAGERGQERQLRARRWWRHCSSDSAGSQARKTGKQWCPHVRDIFRIS